MIEIQKQLSEWRNSRNIKTFPLTIKDDLLKELDEVKEALRNLDFNNYSMEVVDISIFCLNSLGLLNYSYIKQTTSICEIKLSHIESIINQIDITKPIQMKILFCIIIGMCESLVIKKGFNFKKLINEKILVLQSRRQSPQQKKEWSKNGASKKWLKDENQNKDTLYKINFDKCKFIYQK